MSDIPKLYLVRYSISRVFASQIIVKAHTYVDAARSAFDWLLEQGDFDTKVVYIDQLLEPDDNGTGVCPIMAPFPETWRKTERSTGDRQYTIERDDDE